MGVPKFFRYISERYPCLSEFCLEDKIPQFDNLYLDMNGIIHNCSHPDDGNVHFRITEEAMFRDIFKYIDKLFYLIQPQKLFFMAVDGVAPRAKMNQQRSRRFRSAKDAELLEKNAQKRGEKLPDEARFDSNCITPGTEFMVRLQNALQYFVKCKISSNPLWRKCRIILSGHETPGEGEHKIMEYIRYLKTQSNYNPNTRHCLYGLDADLIILGLCTHELHFSLLREEVKFGRKSKPTSLEETRFFLLHLGLLREYLELEFYSLTDKIDDFDIEKLIDDWILMGFLVGNDFIPHLPNLHINTNALPILYKAYMKVRPELGGYINECGQLNLERLEKYFEILAVSEKECFEDVFADLKYFQAKRSGGNRENDIPEAFDLDIPGAFNLDDDLAKLMKDSEDFLGDEFDDNVTEEQLLEEEFTAYKNNYYIEKLKYDKVTPEVIEEQTECYVRALQWILYYYYRGVPSWEWFYPHHYAPFVSDLKNFKHLKIEFELGKPFLPFEQLLAVLPAASRDLLPEAFRDLMINPESELIEYYPKDFKTDLNGKKQDWEAVVLIPFIDEKKLLKAMEACNEKLTKSENERNKHGPMLQYDYTKTSQGSCEGPYSFKPLYNVFCTEKEIWRDDISVPDNYNMNIMPKKGVLRGVYFPGFPTMKHIKYTGELRNARIKVFEQPSRNENMILIPEYRIEETDLYVVAQKYLDKEVYIGWPHLTQAKIIAISTKEKRINHNMDEVKQDPQIYEYNKKAIIDHHMMRMGIDFQDLTILVHALPSAGTEYVFSAHGKMTLKKTWSREEVVYPAQGVISDIATYNPQFVLHKKVEDIFPVNCKIFMLGKPFLGSEGKVLDPQLVYSVGRIKVNLTVLPEPNFSEARKIQKTIEMQYMNSYNASSILCIQPNCLARITGSIFAIEGVRRNNLPDNIQKINIGLQLKFPKSNEELIGYMRKVGSNWLYSLKAIYLIRDYFDHFPRIFELISGCNTRDIYFESDLFPNQVGKNGLKDLVAWLKSLDYHQAERVPCGTRAMEKEAVEMIINATEEMKKLPVKCVTLQVKPHLILKPGLKVPELAKTRKRPLDLFNRVVVVKNTYQVPVGYMGTIVAIHPLTNQNSVRYENVKDVVYFYDVLFDKTLPEGATLHGLGENRVFKISENSILEIYSEDTRKPNENKINAPSQLPISNVNSMKNNTTGSTSKDNGEANQLLYAIIKKCSLNEKDGSNSRAVNDDKIMKHKETIKSGENSQFAESFVKRPPPPSSHIPISSSVKQHQYHQQQQYQQQQQLLQHYQQQQQIQQHLQQQQLQQQLQQQQMFQPPPPSNIPKSFEFISKHEFLKPPSPTQPTNENRKKYFQDDYANKKQEKGSNSSLQTDKLPQKSFKDNKPQGSGPYVHKFMSSYREMDGLKKASNDAVDPTRSTNVLKQILGIDSSNTTKPTSSINEDNNKMRSVPVKNLPKPPPNWRVEASSKNENTNIKPPHISQNPMNQLPSTSGLSLSRNHQQPLEMFFKNSPHTFNNRSYTGPMTAPVATTSTNMFQYQNHQPDLNNQKQHYNFRNQTTIQNGSPASYHMKISNIDITKGKGAFIPLQALKQVKKSQEVHKTQNFTNNHTNPPPVNISQNSKAAANKNETLPESSKNVPTTSKSTTEKKSITPKKYPKPKIAAKFDNSFITP